MSDHAWTYEQIGAYIMGGLTTAEMARVDAHARGCADCTAAIAAARGMDDGMQSLFADVRPGLELEDAAVRSTRTIRRRGITFNGWLPRLAAVAASLLVLCTIGALASAVVGDGRLPMPGYARYASKPAPVTDIKGYSATEGLVVKTTEQLAGEADSRSTTPFNNGKVQYTEDYMSMQSTLLRSPGGGGGGGIQGGIGGIGGGIQGGGPASPPAFGSPLASGPNLYTRGDSNGVVANPSHIYQFAQQPPVTYNLSTVAPNFAPDRFLGGVTPSTNTGWAFKPSEHRPAAPQEGEPGVAPKKPEANPPAEPEPGARRIVIRSGDVEFEVTSFDDAVATITKLVSGLPGAFVATVNSDKLPNGKVKGSVTIRTPPEHLDALVVALRRELGATGELKGMRLGSQDITKQYTDLESRLRAARTMETRLLQVIKDGKGEIKQLLEAEKELGVWRTKIEEIEGEIRYYSNLAALATLTISLTEKEIRAAASISETERVQAGLEVEDVDKAYQQAIAAVFELKGRVTKSELKQLSAGQFNASLQFEVPPDASGPVRDRLRQLGRVARVEIDRVQHPVGGSTPTDAKVKRGDTQFLVQIYNLVNVAPRETAVLHVAVQDVRAGYQALRDAAVKAGARVLTAQMNEQDAKNVTAHIDVEVRRAEEGAIRAAIDAAGEAASRQVTRTPEGDNATDSKVLYRVTFLSANRLSPRETTVLTVEVPDVDQAATVFAAQVAEAKGRQLSAVSSRDQSGKATAKLTFEVPLAAAGIVERFKSAGVVRSHQTANDPQVPGGRFATARFDVTLVNRDQIVGEDDGLWPQVRRGLSFSVAVLLTSVTWVVFGLCVVLPWGLAGYVVYRLFRRRRSNAVLASPTSIHA